MSASKDVKAADIPVEEIQDSTEETNEEELIEEEEDDSSIEIPCDLSACNIKKDHFPGMNILDESFEKVEGAPNFRALKGFPVFATGQPTEEAILEILKRAKKDRGEDGKIIWFLMREEPLLYINGHPYAPRAFYSPHANLGMICLWGISL